METFKRLIDQEKSEPTSADDILKIVKGKANVIKYCELKKYSCIDELLYPYDACVLLYETKPNYGHWVCLTKHGNLIEYFNSYGNLGKPNSKMGMPDTELEFISKEWAKESGQDHRYLSDLLMDESCDYELSYNDHPFQKMTNEVSTCGRWVGLRILLKELPLEVFKDLFYGKHSDDLITFLTSQ
jgi:hypothetical protein